MKLVQLMQNCLSRTICAWQKFWFAPRDLYNVSVFRACLGAIMFVMYSIRHVDIETFFFNNGLLPAARALEILPEFYRSPLPFFFHSDSANYWGHIALLAGLALLTFGVIGRSLTWVVWVLHLGFMQRNFSLVYGADLFANFWLLYLCFINHNRHLNVLHLFCRNKRAISVPDISSDMVSSAFTRLIQIQLTVCYAYTGIEKLKGLQWWEGTAVWYTLGMRELVAWDLTFLRQIPLAIGVLSMAPMIFEVYFPMAMANRKLRAPWLLFGVMFHLGTAIIMDLWFFCLVMTVAYLLFVDSNFLRQMVAFIRMRLALPVKSKT
jgi:hypothetical protein